MSTNSESTKILRIEEIQIRRRVRCISCELVQWATRPNEAPVLILRNLLENIDAKSGKSAQFGLFKYVIGTRIFDRDHSSQNDRCRSSADFSASVRRHFLSDQGFTKIAKTGKGAERCRP